MIKKIYNLQFTILNYTFRASRGFSLLGLIVLIAILGVLVGIALVVFLGRTQA